MSNQAHLALLDRMSGPVPRIPAPQATMGSRPSLFDRLHSKGIGNGEGYGNLAGVITDTADHIEEGEIGDD
jgi:type II secretory pathway component PulF